MTAGLSTVESEQSAEWALLLSVPLLWNRFPWLHPTALSEEVYEAGLHEFLVEVGCAGQIGFVDARFRQEVHHRWSLRMRTMQTVPASCNCFESVERIDGFCRGRNWLSTGLIETT
jgi:hypothetical protein